MKKSITLWLAVLVMAFSSCQNPQPGKQVEGPFTVKRGTNIAHFLSQSDARGAERQAFFTRADVDTLAALGFDHIRLPIDEEQMWDEDMNRHEDAFQLMHNAIDWCIADGLRVIVDLHILRSHHFNEGKRPLWTDPAAQDKFIALWKDLSSELKQYPNNMVAYELMNEAVADNPESWNQLIARAMKVLRETEPDRTIVIGSNRWQSASTFHQLRIPEGDSHILLSFHFYTPMALTHHTASWTGLLSKYSGPVHYPGQIVEEKDLEGYPEDVQQEVRWSSGYFTADTLRKLMQEPLEYAREHQLPLYCGEFGVYHPAPREDALRWYNDMITVMEDEGIGWANWCYKGGFGIYGKDGAIDRDLMKIFFQNKK